MGKYFTVEVKPTITASKQHLGAFDQGDVLFDWTAFNVPKGANKLVIAACVSRGTNGAAQTVSFDLYFAKTYSGTAPGSIGTIHASADGVGYYNNLIGHYHYNANDTVVANNLDRMGVSYSFFNKVNHPQSLVLEGEASSGSNVGYDKLYISATTPIATIDFSTNSLTDSAVDVSGLSSARITTLDGTDCTQVFTAGDIIHAQDDIILGEVDSLDADSLTFKTDGTKQYHAGGEILYTNAANFGAWQIQNGAGAAGDLANNDELYNLHPMTIILMFEK